MNILIWILVGGISGWISSKIIKTNSTQGLVTDIIYGIFGSAIGGGIAVELNKQPVTGLNLYSIMVSIVGAIVLIAIVKSMQKIV